MNKVLVVAVHPDDETLGCGGTLLKHKEKGDKIYWLIATCIEGNESYKDRVEKRKEELEKINRFYGFEKVFNLKLHSTKVDQYPMVELINRISNVFLEVKPTVVYLPFKGDAHSDHRLIFEASHSCTKSFRYGYIKTVYMMEVLSETDFAPCLPENAFQPNRFVDISDFFERKLEIIKTYEDEIGNHPFPRSLENIKALAILRGAQAGVKFAESFVLLREVS